MNLFDFTYCGNYNRQIQNLARISPEKWSFGQSGDNGILKGYLENTFRRLYEEGKVREEKEYALFHTGLFNQYYQPIYAYFVPNVVPDRQKWYLEGFYTDYSLLKIKLRICRPGLHMWKILPIWCLIPSCRWCLSMSIFLMMRKMCSGFLLQ